MPKKKQAKTAKSRGIDPTLKPIVVKTKGGSEEEQRDNPLGRKVEPKLPKGFKTADKLTEVDQLQFEMGRLREMLVTWLDRVMVNGVPYNVLVDPMNRKVELTLEK